MASIILTIPDASLSRVVDGICASCSYEGNKQPAETKAQYAKRMIIKIVKDMIKDAEASPAATTARLVKEAEIETGVLIT